MSYNLRAMKQKILSYRRAEQKKTGDHQAFAVGHSVILLGSKGFLK
jgi:hypothetical protein